MAINIKETQIVHLVSQKAKYNQKNYWRLAYTFSVSYFWKQFGNVHIVHDFRTSNLYGHSVTLQTYH